MLKEAIENLIKYLLSGQLIYSDSVKQFTICTDGFPLLVEWEDCGMDREYGVREASGFVKKINFASSKTIFDSGFGKEYENKKSFREEK